MSEVRKLKRTKVTVFGAGIAGMTAAHELAERGFDVTVYEPAEDAMARASSPAVGGMARTQWTYRPDAPRDTAKLKPTFPPVRLPWTIDFDPGQFVLTDGSNDPINKVAELLRERGVEQIPQLFIEGFSDQSEESSPMDLAMNRANEVKKALEKALEDEKWRGKERELFTDEVSTYVKLIPRALVDAFKDDRFRSDSERRCVRFVVETTNFPGEHGYRFFPSFYYHLFDTMKRIPLMQSVRTSDIDAARARYAEHHAGLKPGQLLSEAREGQRYIETGKTAFDSLRSMPKHALAPEDDAPPVLMTRRAVLSFEDLRSLATPFFRDLGFKTSDILIFNTKLFQFATSCDARRKTEYTKQSWLEFIDSKDYSQSFRDAMIKWPHSLVALSADECDAYTHGVVSLQLLLDQYRNEFTDGTPVGPTSEVWLDPWRSYLHERYEVRFIRAGLCSFFMNKGTLDAKLMSLATDGSWKKKLDGIEAEYFVLALPIEKVASVFPQDVLKAIEESAGSATKQRNDVKLAVHLSKSLGGRPPVDDSLCDVRPESEPADWDVATPKGALRHFSGVQFYFHEEVDWVEGHTYYVDSPWGLSSIAQTAHWNKKSGRRSLHRSVVSVVIGIFNVPGSNGKCAWDCSAKELAEETWKQIKAGAESQKLRLPDPAYYHVDDNLVFKDDATGGIRHNRSPFLVPVLGTWDDRPGEPDDYTVHLDKLVLAGTYMKTHTRLTTMEAANESARHAVNAILEHRYRTHPEPELGLMPGVRCDVRSMEDREAPDAKLFKEIDEVLFQRGMPHFMDILDWKTWHWLPLGSAAKLLRRLLGIE